MWHSKKRMTGLFNRRMLNFRNYLEQEKSKTYYNELTAIMFLMISAAFRKYTNPPHDSRK